MLTENEMIGMDLMDFALEPREIGWQVGLVQ